MSSGSPWPAASAATMRPRTQRLLSSKRSAVRPTRPAREADPAPAARSPAEAHHALTGHASHRGRRAVHTVAPSSIIAWFHAAARPAGRSAAGAPRPSRSATRRAFVSTAATCAPNANDATAAAVYGPTPGSVQRSSGQPRAATTCAAACSATARRL